MKHPVFWVDLYMFRWIGLNLSMVTIAPGRLRAVQCFMVTGQIS